MDLEHFIATIKKVENRFRTMSIKTGETEGKSSSKETEKSY